MSSIKVVAAVIIKNDQVLIARRPDGKHKAGYWEDKKEKLLKRFKNLTAKDLRYNLRLPVDYQLRDRDVVSLINASKK